MRLARAGVAAFVTVLATVLVPATASAGAGVQLVASGLDSPRGITFIGSKAVVAESGHGGNSPSDCVAVPPPVGMLCIGGTSKITWVNTGTGAKTPMVRGLFSESLGPLGTEGAMGLAYADGRLYVQMGGTGREVPPPFAGIGREAGNLLSVNPWTGDWEKVAAVGNHDYDYTLKFTPPDPTVCGQCPGTQEHDANPTFVMAMGNGWLVADSGANTLTWVGEDGVRVVHHFTWRDPNPMDFASDEVPTCVARADGALWIGTLSGHLYRMDGEDVTRVTPRDSTGMPLLSHVTGCTSGPGGRLYLVNMFGPGLTGAEPTFADGSVVMYNPDKGTGSMLADAFTSPALFLPYSATIGPDGDLYVTSGAICDTAGDNPIPGSPVNPCVFGSAKGGRVVRIDL